MKIIGIIPARYQSSRFPGKPLADICGKPMVWWVYQQSCKVEAFDEVVVATDDERIKNVCKQYAINCLMTDNNHPNHIHRIHQVSTIIESDLYVCINGDEPMLSPDVIKAVIPKHYDPKSLFIAGLMREFEDPAEVIDFAKIKIAVNEANESIYMSRSPIPYPRGSLLFKYNKYVGVECFNRKALDFFNTAKKGVLEIIEDIDHLRFIENGIRIKFSPVLSRSISVDTPKDIEKVRILMQEKLPGEITS